MIDDMSLSDFISRVVARRQKEGRWEVRFNLPTGQEILLGVEDCYSEFEAKERCFLYLKERIEDRKMNRDAGRGLN